jgi:hypothetical protein
MAPLFEQSKIYLRKCTEQEIIRDNLTKEPNPEKGYNYDETRMVVVHPEFWELYEQLMTYPRSQYDDILDALEMSIETSRSGRKLFDEIIMV